MSPPAIPFQELYTPLLAQYPRPSSPYLTPLAYSNIERAVLERLTRVVSPILQHRFAAFRASHQPSLTQWVTTTHRLYHHFIETMRNGQWGKFLHEYPVLARLTTVILTQWAASTLEFMERLAQDWPELAQTFTPQAELGQVESVKPFCSDPHQGGRTVWAVHFTQGTTLFYKPRRLAPDQVYDQFINQLHDLGLQPRLKTLPMLMRPAYGWVAAAQPHPCPNKAALSRYYYRAGMLLALAYLLQATDGHYENLIAAGEYPVLVDLETLFHPSKTAFSVHDTNLLPSLTSPDLSGFNGHGGQTTRWRDPLWQHVNTDAMSLTYQPRLTPEAYNRPTLGGIVYPPQNYLTELTDGFSALYRFCQHHRSPLQAWLATHHALPTRFVGRMTDIYGALLRQNLSPQVLRAETDWAQGLSRLAHYSPELHPLLPAEYQALSQLDLPYFSALGQELQAEYGVSIPQFFESSGLDHVLSKWQHLSETDLAQQLTLIRQALIA